MKSIDMYILHDSSLVVSFSKYIGVFCVSEVMEVIDSIGISAMTSRAGLPSSLPLRGEIEFTTHN